MLPWLMLYPAVTNLSMWEGSVIDIDLPDRHRWLSQLHNGSFGLWRIAIYSGAIGIEWRQNEYVDEFYMAID